MKKVKIILVIILLASIFIIQNYNQNQELNLNKNIFAFDIKGSDKINDNEFKKVLLDYISIDVKRDYLSQYNLLSSFYLERYYKNITSAEEYQKMEKQSEIVVLGYLEITAYELLNENKYQVDLIRKDGFEGEEYIKKVRYYFIKENNTWKLFDTDLLD
ncbi:MAG: hypothetical protein GX075_03985 [Firmicutes bacterium]|nr:hypothetical protein [Bacillota bacterium]